MEVVIKRIGEYEYYEKVNIDIAEVNKATSMHEVFKKIDEFSSGDIDQIINTRYGEISIKTPHDSYLIETKNPEYLRLQKTVMKNKEEKEFDEKYQLKIPFEYDN